MKNKVANLSVDFIGEKEPLTQAEIIALSNFFKNKKLKNEAKKKKSRIDVSKEKLQKA